MDELTLDSLKALATDLRLWGKEYPDLKDLAREIDRGMMMRCKHCRLLRFEHADDKCLTEPTMFAPGQPVFMLDKEEYNE